MNRSVSTQTDSLANAFVSGQLSRRQFVSRMLAMGLSVPMAGAVLAACSAKAPASSAAKGTVRFLIGPWTDAEIKHQQVIAAAFTKNHPGISFTFKLYDWDTANATIDASLIQNAHDIYYFGEADYL
jgi:multiple sugar transport system substrate-binding protein